MIIAAVALSCFLAIVVFIQLGALVEMFRQIQQIRTHLDMVDRPLPLDLGAQQGISPSALGLPSSLDNEQTAMVLFLSNTCATCRSIAAALRGAVPQTLWVVVEPVFSDDADLFIEEFSLQGERVLVDRDGSIAGRLGLDITPSAIFVQDGRIERAQTVPSIRQLFSVLPVVRPLSPARG